MNRRKHAVVHVLSYVAVAICAPFSGQNLCLTKDEVATPVKWSRLGSAPHDHTVNLHIGLKNAKFHELERHLLESGQDLSL